MPLSCTTTLITFPIDLKTCMDIQNASYLKYLSLEFSVGHVLVGVNRCGRGTVVALLPQVAKHPKKSQNNGFDIYELI